jgi:flagellar export protein FliJ
MPFRFALAPLLRLRQSIQRQRTLQLQEANFQVSRVQATLAQLEGFLAASTQYDSTNLKTGRTAAELQFAAILREKLHLYRQDLESEVHKLEVVRQKALGEYHQAYRDREVLDTLRARQRHEYQQDQSHRQQAELDAAYLLQRWHRRS